MSTRSFVATVFAILVFAGVSSTAHAGMPIKQAGNFGIGLGAGTTAVPISMKYFLDSSFSIQGNVGWWWRGGFGGCHYYDRYRRYRGGCYGGPDALGLGADFLFEGGPLVGNQNVTLDWEVGGGAGIGLADYAFGLAGAFVAGLQLNIHAIPIDLVLEYRLIVGFVPYYFDPIEFTGHIRYYF